MKKHCKYCTSQDIFTQFVLYSLKEVRMILSATLSKPTAAVRDVLGNDFVRIKIKLITASTGASADEPQYFAEMFTKTQVFHKKMMGSELDAFIAAQIGVTFKSCVKRTETEEITLLANKKGKLTQLARPAQKMALSTGQRKLNPQDKASEDKNAPHAQNLQSGAIPSSKARLNRTKNYIIAEGTPVPFLVHLGVMTAQGKVIASKYDKFRQINRFLEYVDDILPEILSAQNASGTKHNPSAPLRIVDFGSGKSYLTFAVQYFLTEVRHIDCDITGLDLKEDVISYCKRLASELKLSNLHFSVGDIASYGENARPDLVITLHACDTATDYALHYAITHNASAILSVPCCQHELNAQLSYKATDSGRINQQEFAPLLKHGLLKERFAALATDALRAEYLEEAGYKVQVMEFIDMAHTPKNLLIRAVRKQNAKSTRAEADALTNALGVTQTLGKLLEKTWI